MVTDVTTADVNEAQRRMVDCNHDDPTIWSGHLYVRWCSTCGSIQIQPTGGAIRPWEDFPSLTPSRIYKKTKKAKKPTKKATP